MSESAARVVLLLASAYACAGGLLALAFHAVGLVRVDPAARGAGLIFRVLITPGLVALWPVVAHRWLRGSPIVVDRAGAPRRLRSAHRILVYLLAIALPLVIAVALVLRPPDLPAQPLPPELGSHGVP